jgi:anti-sigma factor RsiW
MKHKEIERLIQEWLDGDLSPDDNARLDMHIAQCPECALFYQEITQATRLVHQLGELHPKTDFNARILARLGLRRRFAWK